MRFVRFMSLPEISERIQECDQVILVALAEVGELITSCLSLAVVGEDREKSGSGS